MVPVGNTPLAVWAADAALEAGTDGTIIAAGPGASPMPSTAGDFCRTGVIAILMPDVKTGVSRIVGPVVVLHQNLPGNKIIMLKQETTIRDGSPDRYGCRGEGHGHHPSTSG